MANMSYSRFRNTLEDLRDCYNHLDENLGEQEERARDALIELCRKIVEEFD